MFIKRNRFFILLAVLLSVIFLACGRETEVLQEEVAQAEPEDEIIVEALSGRQVARREMLSEENLLVVFWVIKRYYFTYHEEKICNQYLMYFADGEVYMADAKYCLEDSNLDDGRPPWGEDYSDSWWDNLEDWRYLGNIDAEQLEDLKEKIATLGEFDVRSSIIFDENYEMQKSWDENAFFGGIFSYREMFCDNEESGGVICDTMQKESVNGSKVQHLFMCSRSRAEVLGGVRTEEFLNSFLEDRFFRYWGEYIVTSEEIEK